MEKLLDLFHTLFGQRYKLVFFIYDEISGFLDFFAHDGRHLGYFSGGLAAFHLGREDIAGFIELGGLSALTGNDQRGTGFVNQNRVYLVDDGIGQPSLYQLFLVNHHVIPKIVKPVLVIGHIGDVAVICRTALVPLHAVQHAAYRETEEFMHLAHPAGVTAGQVIVDRNNVNTLPGKRIQIGRHGGNQCLSFSGLHLRNPSLMEDNSADDLHPVGLHVQHPLCCLSYRGKRLRKKVVQRLPVFQAILVLLRFCAKLFIRQVLHRRTEAFNFIYERLNPFQLPLTVGAKNFF